MEDQKITKELYLNFIDNELIIFINDRDENIIKMKEGIEKKLNTFTLDLLKDPCLVDDMVFIGSLAEETQQQRTFKYGYIEYMQEKYDLTDRDMLFANLLVNLNLENKYLTPYENGKPKYINGKRNRT